MFYYTFCVFDIFSGSGFELIFGNFWASFGGPCAAFCLAPANVGAAGREWVFDRFFDCILNAFWTAF